MRRRPERPGVFTCCSLTTPHDARKRVTFVQWHWVPLGARRPRQERLAAQSTSADRARLHERRALRCGGGIIRINVASCESLWLGSSICVNTNIKRGFGVITGGPESNHGAGSGGRIDLANDTYLGPTRA